MTDRPPYPSDLSDARWRPIEPILTAWRTERRGNGLDLGRPPIHDLREILNAILYFDRTGIPWRYRPHDDLPPWPTVYGYFAKWEKAGIFAQLSSLLRGQVREQASRNGEPSAGVMDSQSVKTSTNVPLTSQGIDQGKKIVGRKRNILADSIGLLLAVIVTAASAQDHATGALLLGHAAATHPALHKVWVDGGYRPMTVEHGAEFGIDVEIVRRDPSIRGFTVLPRRWVVERTLGWFMNFRSPRLCNPAPRSIAMIHLAMVDLLNRRLTGESTPTWRGT
jgi:transposase